MVVVVKPPPAGADEDHVVPSEVSTLPLVPAAIPVIAEVPAPTKTLFAVSVAAPLPPLATGKVPVTPVVKVTCPDEFVLFAS